MKTESPEVPDDYVIFQHPTLDLVRAIRDYLAKTNPPTFTIEVLDDTAGVVYVLHVVTITVCKTAMIDSAKSFETGWNAAMEYRLKEYGLGKQTRKDNDEFNRMTSKKGGE